jgi:hypothetical protein
MDKVVQTDRDGGVRLWLCSKGDVSPGARECHEGVDGGEQAGRGRGGNGRISGANSDPMQTANLEPPGWATTIHTFRSHEPTRPQQSADADVPKESKLESRGGCSRRWSPRRWGRRGGAAARLCCECGSR